MFSRIDFEYVNCNLCNEDSPELFCRIRGAQTGCVFDIVRCQNCGLFYTNPRLARRSVATLYSASYYSGEGFDPSFRGGTTTSRGAGMALRWMRDVYFRLSRPIRLLDVGGGQGDFALSSMQLGYDALLVELGESGVEGARSRGVHAYQGEITDPFFHDQEEHYDVVTAWEVVEHLYDPRTFFSRVYRLLRPGGLFLYSTGNANEARFWRSRWGYFQVPEGHLYFYNPKTIRWFLSRAGFKKFLDPYRIYYKETVGVRAMAKFRLINLDTATHPDSRITRILYGGFFKRLEWTVGRERLPFAIK